MKLRKLLLLIIPICFITIELVYVSYRSPQYATDVDPEYAYFYNGLGFAKGFFNPAHIDHPGTPLQLLNGLVIRTMCIFQDKEEMTLNALTNPEKYIHIISIILVLINALGIYLMGNTVFGHSKNWIKSLSVQLMTFASAYVIFAVTRLRPEALLIFSALVFSAICYSFIHNYDKQENRKKYIIYFALIMGASIALKISYIPYFFIPLIVLEKWKDKISYAVFTAIAFLIFAFPILGKLKMFYEWIVKMLTHDGLYGGGEEKIVDASHFTENLKAIFTDNPIFSFSFFILIPLLALPFFKKNIFKNNLRFRILIGFLVAFILQVLLIAKHYKNYYITPTNLFPVFVILIYTEMAFSIFNLKGKNIKHLIFGAIFIFFIGHSFNIIKNEFVDVKRKHNNRLETLDYVNKNQLKPLIIASFYYNAPFKEYALFFGNIWTGNHRFHYFERLEKLYPNTYLFYPWDNQFHYWSDQGSHPTVLPVFDSVYVYKYNQSPDMSEKINNGLKTDSLNYRIERIFFNENTQESIDLYKIE